MGPSLIIGGIELQTTAILDFDQTFEPIGGAPLKRMNGGAARRQRHWRKWKTTISGGGWQPAPLLMLDFDRPMELHCALPVSLPAGVALPAGWRMRDGAWSEKTITDEAGQLVRLVWPILTVYAEPPRLRHGNGMAPGWEMVCEEA